MGIIAFTGFAQSGKDTSASALTEIGWEKVAFADAVREVALAINPYVVGETRLSEIVEKHGWERAKLDYPEVRRLLQRTGTEAGRDIFGENIWVALAAKKVSLCMRQGKSVVITDCRFPNEALYVRAMSGKVVRIVRPGVEAVNGHASEALAFCEDETIVNDGTIEELRAKVLELSQKIIPARVDNCR